MVCEGLPRGVEAWILFITLGFVVYFLSVDAFSAVSTENLLQLCLHYIVNYGALPAVLLGHEERLYGCEGVVT